MKNLRLLMCAIVMLMASCAIAQNNFGQQLIARAAARAAEECPRNGIVDKGNILELTVVKDYGAFWLAVVMTAEFDGDQPSSKCIKCTETAKCSMPGVVDESEASEDLTEAYAGMTKETVLNIWKEVYGDIIDDDDDDDPTPGEGGDDEPSDVVTTGYIQDLGDKLVLKYRAESASTGKWGDGTITVKFDGSDEESLCVKADLHTITNIEGEEEINEDITGEFEGMTKAQVRAILTLMLDIIVDAPDALSTVSTDAAIEAIYDINGAQLPSLQKGINVLKTAKGNRVVIVK